MDTTLQEHERGLLTEALFSDRIRKVPRSFIREILKVAGGKDIISFAGGLPNPDLFPVAELQESCNRVMATQGQAALQYSNSEGYLPLREYIADRYLQTSGLHISPEDILITSGSQQGLDLLGKIFLNRGDQVIIEEPGYLGAIQALSIFEPEFLSIPLEDSGINTILLRQTCSLQKPKLMYCVPDFQNPSGHSYSETNRQAVAQMVAQQNMLIIEDNPYTDIRFKGKRKSSFYKLLPDQTIMLGTFSKTAVPGFRLGWIVAPDLIMSKLITAKQAADLHTNSFTQRVLHDFLIRNNIDQHISKIANVYGEQCLAMLHAITQYFPEEVAYSQPEGGMFLWAKLPDGISAKKLFDRAIQEKVAFVPGAPFYANGTNDNSMRLNYSCTDEATINTGIHILGNILKNIQTDQ